MGTYYNPGLQKSYSRNVRKDKPADAGLLSLIKSRQESIANDKLRSEANWKIRQETLAKTDTDRQTLISAGRNNGVDMESLVSSTSKVMKEYANRKIRLSQATSKYDGYEEDETFVRNTKSMIDNAADTFGIMKNAVSNYRKAMEVGFGDGPGAVASESIAPGFQAMTEMAKPGSNIKGTISWEMNYDETSGWAWNQIAKGEAIKEANKKMGIDSDTYVLSYQKMFDINKNNDGSHYNHSDMYNTNPVVVDDEDKKFLQEQKIYNEDNAIEDKYYIKGQATKGNSVFDTKEVNLKKLYNDLKPTSTSIFYRIAQGTDNVVAAGPRAYLGNGVEKEVIDGLTQYVYYKPSFKENGGLKTDSEGKPYKDPSNKVILGDDKLGGGQFIRVPNEENYGRYGFNEEQFKEYTDWVHYQTAWNSGAFINPQDEVNESATKALQQKRRYWDRDDKPNMIKKLIDDTSETVSKLIEENNFDEIAIVVQDLAALNGITIESDSNHPSMITAHSTNNGKTVRVGPVDIATASGRQNFYNLMKLGEISDKPAKREKTEAQIGKEENEDFDYKVAELINQKPEDAQPGDSFIPRPDDAQKFLKSFNSGQLEDIGITIKRDSHFGEGYISKGNALVAVTEEGGKTLFDPSTKKGKDRWEALVRAQLLKNKKSEPKPDYKTIQTSIPTSKKKEESNPGNTAQDLIEKYAKPKTQ